MKKSYVSIALLIFTFAFFSLNSFAQVQVYHGGESQFETEIKGKITYLYQIANMDFNNPEFQDFNRFKQTTDSYIKYFGEVYKSVNSRADISERNKALLLMDILEAYNIFLSRVRDFSLIQAEVNRRKAEEISVIVERGKKFLRELEAEKNKR